MKEPWPTAGAFFLPFFFFLFFRWRRKACDSLFVCSGPFSSLFSLPLPPSTLEGFSWLGTRGGGVAKRWVIFGGGGSAAAKKGIFAQVCCGFFLFALSCIGVCGVFLPLLF